MEKFRTLEREARENKRGLWADTQEEALTAKVESKAGKYPCERKTCKQISTCEEAMFLLNECGFSRLDGDKDGIPCEKLCEN